MGTPGKVDPAVFGHPIVPAIQWPITLRPKASFHLGLAALVFVRPHVLDPVDDLAEYGYLAYTPGADPALEYTPQPPFEDARVVAWFRPPALEQEYIVQFSCTGQSGSSFTLDTGDGAPEQQAVPSTGVSQPTTEVTLSKACYPNEHEWFPFSVSSPGYWKLESCEIATV